MINPGAGNINSISRALLASIAILKANEYNSTLKKIYTNLRDWINVITLLYEKTSKTSMVDKKNCWKRSWGIEKNLEWLP